MEGWTDLKQLEFGLPTISMLIEDLFIALFTSLGNISFTDETYINYCKIQVF